MCVDTQTFQLSSGSQEGVSSLSSTWVLGSKPRSSALAGSTFTIWPLIYISQQPFEDLSSETHKVTYMTTVNTIKHSFTLGSSYIWACLILSLSAPLSKPLNLKPHFKKHPFNKLHVGFLLAHPEVSYGSQVIGPALPNWKYMKRTQTATKQQHRAVSISATTDRSSKRAFQFSGTLPYSL